MTQVRKACLNSLPSDTGMQAIVPVPMDVISSDNYSLKEVTSECEGSFVEVTSHGMTIRINKNTSSSLIAKVLGGFNAPITSLAYVIKAIAEKQEANA